MRKLQFKKILSIIDVIELRGISYEETPICLYEEMANEYFSMKLPELKAMIEFLHHMKILKSSENGIDLSPAATIYAKSNQNSGIEALSMLETFINDTSIFQFYNQQMKSNSFISKEKVLQYMDMETLQLMTQTTLFEVNQETLRFHPRLLKGIQSILDEYHEEVTPLISMTLTALYTSNIVAHEDLRINYKNTNSKMVNYQFKDTLLNIIPRRGIPHDRDETRALQAFYKDTLFHEFDHSCPLCHINIPHMLIASHIKPFRDCAHIYEAIDHDNGLLLCRNHDYLFDQGYITFDDKGYIIIAKQLLTKDNMESSFAIYKNYRLPERYLTKNRKLFLAYHREHIFKNDK